MIISIIVAIARNNVIGKDNKLLWHLPNDLKWFKSQTDGKCVIMGRKTYESIGKTLSNRTIIIITRQLDYKAEGCTIVHSLEEALNQCNRAECYIAGGAEIYQLALPIAQKIYLTQIDATFEGDAFFPKFDESLYNVLQFENFEADEKHAYPYSISVLSKRPDHLQEKGKI